MDHAKTNTAILRFESLDSTNEEALRQLACGSETPLWIIAAEQTRGRGRGGRRWHSPKGNLYATLLMETSVSAATATQLSFVAGLAAYDAIAAHVPSEELALLRLKWPNDVLLDYAKVAGVLLESLQARRSGNLAVVLGIGINVSKAPAQIDRRAASLGLGPMAVNAMADALIDATDRWLSRWQEGEGFAIIREAWLKRAVALDEAVSVHLNGTLARGKFKGIDSTGALELEIEPGVVITVTAGDIYPDALASDR